MKSFLCFLFISLATAYSRDYYGKYEPYREVYPLEDYHMDPQHNSRDLYGYWKR
jgi:hypothetical protein